MFKVTLSFDNGPEPGVTPRVIEVLEAHDIKASFFVAGSSPGTARRT
ncbi:MAG TPA: polysaccharide deacetylase family protein [Candidatus Binataceae bacterium]|nr:polysaccharide deacetylase family protein [Candidatus Binataceae bacterium]